MTAVIMRNKATEMKGLVEQGLHIFGKVMNMCEQMCEGDMGERYYGHKDYDYPYGDRMGMYDHHPMYPIDPYMGERQGMRGTGRYSMYR